MQNKKYSFNSCYGIRATTLLRPRKVNLFLFHFLIPSLLVFVLMAGKTDTEKIDTGKIAENTAFTLHPSDNPGAIMVSSSLNGDNYTMWSKAMIKTLSAKNKSGFVTGTITKPSTTTDENYVPWKQCDDMVASRIMNAIIPELAGDAIYAETARDLWEDLEERFSQISGPRIFELQKKALFRYQKVRILRLFITPS